MNTLPPLPQERLWLVDGYNYLHAVILGGRQTPRWWSEEHRARVVASFEHLIRSEPTFANKRIRLLFDGDSSSEEPSSAVAALTLEFHADADIAIVEACEQARAAGTTALVVSADRSLGDRCRARGARVLKPWQLPTPKTSP